MSMADNLQQPTVSTIITKTFVEHVNARTSDKTTWVQADSAETILAMAEAYAELMSELDNEELAAPASDQLLPHSDKPASDQAVAARAAKRNNAYCELRLHTYKLSNPSQFRQHLAKLKNWPDEPKKTKSTSIFNVDDLLKAPAAPQP